MQSGIERGGNLFTPSEQVCPQGELHIGNMVLLHIGSICLPRKFVHLFDIFSMEVDSNRRRVLLHVRAGLGSKSVR